MKKKKMATQNRMQSKLKSVAHYDFWNETMQNRRFLKEQDKLLRTCRVNSNII